MSADEHFDVVVVGGGPSGLFTALAAARSGARVCLLEKGGAMAESLCPKVRAVLKSKPIRDAERFRQQCARCNCLEGLGGAAFHFDTTLGYTRGLSRSKVESRDGRVVKYSALERTLGSFERAEALIQQVYEIFYSLGLPRATNSEDTDSITRHSQAFAHVDVAPSQPVTVEHALQVIRAIRSEIEALGGEIRIRSLARSVCRSSSQGFSLRVDGPHGAADIHSDTVVLAVGKPALEWLVGSLRELNVAFRPARRVDLGVRLETFRDDIRPLHAACHNPKLSFLNERDEPVRTFCVCDGGRIMQYSFAGVTVLDGQHCLEHPTDWSNLGILVSAAVPEGADGTRFALEFASRVNRTGRGRPVVQSVGDLFGLASSSAKPFNTSLVEHTRADLRECLPESVVADIGSMIERLNTVFPGSVGGHSVIAAPVIERIFPEVELTEDLETSVPGLFLVGDCSSKIIGITYGAATGLAAAAALSMRIAPRTRDRRAE